jgi:two-component system, NarL family, nitrate/nitrite response regulator NarL
MDILLCDDHQLLVDALTTSLNAKGHRVVGSTTSVATAAPLAEELSPDICLVDVTFPDGSGIDAVREIVQRVPTTKVLMLSASRDPTHIREAFSAGALGFVRKDDSIEGVLRAIRRVAAGEIALETRLLQTVVGQGASRRGAVQTGSGVRLTEREHEVLELIVAGRGTDEIARDLHIAVSTARSHIQSVLAKIGVHNRLQAAAMAVRQGIITSRT